MGTVLRLLAISVLAYLGLVLPLQGCLSPDLDSAALFASPGFNMAAASWEKWGLYRIIGFYILDWVYAIPGLADHWYSVELLVSIGSKLLLVLMTARLLRLDRSFLPLLLALAIGNVLALGSVLTLARALNETLAIILLAVFGLLLGRGRLGAPRAAVLSGFYGLLSVLIYESHLFMGYALFIAANRNRWKPIVLGAAVVGIGLVAMQMDGRLLRSPKLQDAEAATEVVAVAPSKVTGGDSMSYLEKKITQVETTFGKASALCLSLASALSLILVAVLAYPGNRGSGTQGVTGYLEAVLLLGASIAPLLVAFASAASTTATLGVVNWVLVSAAIYLVGLAVLTLPHDKRIGRYIATGVTVSFFFLSVVLVGVLGDHLRNEERHFLSLSLFKNFYTQGQFAKCIDRTQ